MPKFTTPAGTTQRYIAALDRNVPDSIPGTKKVYADRDAFLQGVDGERACIAMGLPVWYDGIDLQVLAEPAAVKRLWSLSTSAGSPAANAAASHGRTVVIAFKEFTLASDDNRVHATSGVPGSGVGDNGDLALDEASGVVYRKAAGSWAQEAAFGGGASGGGVEQVAYSTTIPLDGNKVMPRTQIAGAVALIIGAKTPGGQCRIPLLSNGANTPTLAGAAEWNTSTGYDNTTGGLLNVLDVWTDDGVNVAISWSQPVVNTGADVVAPTITGRAVANAAPTVVVVTFSEAMDTGFVPASSAFAVSGHTVSSVAFASSTVLNVTVSSAFVSGEAARTLSYTQPGTNNLRDAAGNLLANVSGAAITNNVLPSDVTAPTLSTAVVNGANLVLTYNEALTTSPLPATSAFSVSGAAGGGAQTPSAVAISGSAVTLTLTTEAEAGDTITASYTVPGSNPVRDLAGNSAAALVGQAVTNSTPAGLQAQTTAYMGKVSADGGAVSNTVRDAIDAFFVWFNTNSMGSVITEISCPFGDVVAAKVPLLSASSRRDVWEGGLSYAEATGWTTDGTGYVRTGVNPATTGFAAAYLRTDITSEATSRALFGSIGNSNTYNLRANANGNGAITSGAYQGAWGQASTPFANGTGGVQKGLWAIVGGTSPLVTIYKNGVQTATTSSSATRAASGVEFWVFANNNNGVIASPLANGQSIGYWAYGGIASEAQLADFYAQMQTLLTAVGRNVS